MHSPQVIGTIDGSGRVTLVDKQAAPGTPTPVDLNLDQVLGKMPNKTFTFDTSSPVLQALSLPEGTTPQQALERVLRLPSVCSKRFLTTKVDRHVTGGWVVLGVMSRTPSDKGWVVFVAGCLCWYEWWWCGVLSGVTDPSG